MAGTYYNPGRVIDTSVGQFTKGVEDIEKSLAKQAELKENEEKNRIKLQNKLNEDLLGLSSSINEFPEYAEITIDDQVKSTLQDKYEEVYRLGVDSIGKDNSAYLKAKRELEVAAKEAGLFLAAFNSEGQKFEDSESLELDQVGAALLAQDTNRIDFIRDYNKGGSNIKPELVNGVWVFKMKDEDGEDFIVNSRAYLNEKQPFLNYLEDDTEKLDLIFDNYAENYKNLEQKIKNKTLNGEKITQTEIKSMEEANAFLVDALKNDKNLVDGFNRVNYQRLPNETRLNLGEFDENNDRQKEAYINFQIDRIRKRKGLPDLTTVGIATDEVTIPERRKQRAQKQKSTSETIKAEEKSFGDKLINNLKDLKEGKQGSEDPYIGTDLDGRNIRKITRDGNKITFVTQDLDKSGKPTGDAFNQTFNLNNKKDIEKLERKLLKQTPRNYNVAKIETYINEKTGDFIVGEEEFDVDPLISFDEFNGNETDVVEKLEKLYPDTTFKEASPGVDAISVEIDDGVIEEFRLDNRSDYDDFIKLVEPSTNKSKKFDPNNFKKKNNTEQIDVKVKEEINSNNVNIKVEEEVEEKTNKTRDVKSENKKQEDLMRNSEVVYGGRSGDNTYGLTDYKDYDFQYYLNSKDQVQEGVNKDGKKATYWGGDQPKKGLKTDLDGKVYDGLSDGQQAMMRMQHVNIGWDPRVTILLASGAIKPSERGEYLRDYNKTTTKYNDNKAKFKNIDDQKMFDQWVDLYANSEPNEKGLQKQYKRRVEDMAKAYGYKLTKEQLDKFKV